MELGDARSKAQAFAANLERHEFLHEIFPFHPSVYELLGGLDARLAESGFEASYLTEDLEERIPKLHVKNQLFMSNLAVESLAPLPEVLPVIEEYMAARAKQLAIRENYVDVKELRATIEKSGARLRSAWLKQLTPEERNEAVFYLTIGSHNQDYRGKIMDGEVLCVVAGTQATVAYLDFFTIMGLTTWVESIEELEELVPRQGGLWQRIGRHLKNAL